MTGLAAPCRHQGMRARAGREHHGRSACRCANAQASGFWRRAHLGGEALAIAGALHADLAQRGSATDLIAFAAYRDCAGARFVFKVRHRHRGAGSALRPKTTTTNCSPTFTSWPASWPLMPRRARGSGAVHERGQGHQEQRVARHVFGTKPLP